MKIGWYLVFTSIVLLFLFSGIATAQIDAGLADYYAGDTAELAQQNLDANVEPLRDLFGFYSGGGLYNTAKTHGTLGFDVGIRGIMMFVGDDMKSDWDGGALGGEKGGPLGDYSVVPLPLLQASVGLGSGLDLIGRFFSYPIAENAAGDAENITLIGAGIKYGLVQNMLMPRISVIAAYHKLIVPADYDFGDIGTASVDLVISKGIPFLATIYGGFGIDHTTMNVEIEVDGTTIKPDPYTATNFRGVVGIKLDFIPFVFINADYNFGVHQGVSLGMGLSLR